MLTNNESLKTRSGFTEALEQVQGVESKGSRSPVLMRLVSDVGCSSMFRDCWLTKMR